MSENRMSKPRDYQTKAINSLFEYIQNTDKGSPLVIIPTGGGKGYIMGEIAEKMVEWGCRLLLLAHVKELVEQNAAQAGRNLPFGSVGIFSAGLKRKETANQVISAGIQSVWNKAVDLGKFDLILIDECFAGDTLIDTPRGKIRMDQLRSNDHIYNQIGIGRIESIFSKKTNDLYEVELDDGSKIKCTGDHPFFTDSGWVEVRKLEKGSSLFSREGMSLLWESIQALDEDGREWSAEELHEGEGLEQAKVLLGIVCEEARQPNEIQGESRQDGKDVEENSTQADQARRKWETFISSASRIASCLRGGVGSGIRDTNKTGAQKRCLSELLQSGYRKSRKNDSDRDRRLQPHINHKEGARRKEDKSSCFPRVVSVSRLEREGDGVVYNLRVSGHPSYFANGVAVHNCHRLPAGDEGTYQKFLAEMRVINPKVRVAGLTATPFRMKEGHIASDDGIFDDIAYEVGVRQLISQGYLSKVTSKVTREGQDFSKLHSRAGEFVQEEVDALMDNANVIEHAISEFTELCKERKRIMIFCCSVAHSKHVADEVRRYTGEEVGEVYGDTPDGERDSIIDKFKRGVLRWLTNVAVLTTGFDCPSVDCVIMMRPTKSTGLWQQIVGRGLRLADGKENCLVLDYGGNIERHGPIDAPRIQSNHKKKKGDGTEAAPTRVCEECLTACLAAYRTCPECGHKFEREGESHEGQASTLSILSIKDKKREWKDVKKTTYSEWDSKSGNVTMMIDYEIGIMESLREWVCIQHENGTFARSKAVEWWTERSVIVPVPKTAEEAVHLARDGAVAEPSRIHVEYPPEGSDGWPKIIGFELGEKPDYYKVGGEEREEEDPFFTYAGNGDQGDDEEMPF